MGTLGNGSVERGSAPRFRLDTHPGASAESDYLGTGHSGRRFVLWAVLAILVIWGVLYLFFARWRAGYRERTAYARVALAPTVDPLAKMVPPGALASTWVQTVSETHDMLNRLAASNILSLAQIQELRGDLLARVARARPETATRLLLEIWVEMDTKAGPALRSQYPGLFKFAMAVNPFAYLEPAEIDPSDWREAVAETRVMLVAVTASGEMQQTELNDLAMEISLGLSEAQPDTAIALLTLIWDKLAARAPTAVSSIPRPAILAPRKGK